MKTRTPGEMVTVASSERSEEKTKPTGGLDLRVRPPPLLYYSQA